MSITTHLARSYAIRVLIIAVLSVGFGVWGAYDLWVKLPAEQKAYDEFTLVEAQRLKFEQRNDAGENLTTMEREEWQALEEKTTELSADGVPSEPSTFDALIQWLYVSCIPFGVWYGFVYAGLKRRIWRLDEEGNFHFPGGNVWTPDEIADIDMSKWMAKSKAFVVHTDGRRELLDDYIHKNSHLIVGALAHARYPELWHEDSREVKPEATDADSPSPDDEWDDQAGDGDGIPEEITETVKQTD